MSHSSSMQSSSMHSSQDIADDKTAFRHVGIVVLTLCGVALALVGACIIVSSSL